MNKTQGFTLLEVIVSLTILAVGIIAVMRLVPMALQNTHKAAEQTTVASLARMELGRARAGGVYNQDGFGSWVRGWAEQNAANMLNEAQRAYSMYNGWRTSVERVGGGMPGVDLYRVTFSVRLMDGREEKFVTYITEM
jgi:prepilin-type N-terminal cleavage/methylation domain-containing protein